MKKTTASDAVAFLIVECGLSMEEAMSLDVEDPLYRALIAAYEERLVRMDKWMARVSYCSANAFGGSKESDETDFRMYEMAKDVEVKERDPEDNSEYAKWANYAMEREHIKRYVSGT